MGRADFGLSEAPPWQHSLSLGVIGVGGWASILKARTSGTLARGLCRYRGEKEEGEGRRPYSGGSGTYGTSFLAQEREAKEKQQQDRGHTVRPSPRDRQMGRAVLCPEGPVCLPKGAF